MEKLLLIDIDDTLCNSSVAYARAQKACFKYLRRVKPELSEKQFNNLYTESKRRIHKLLGATASSHNRFLYFQTMFEMLGLPIQPKLLNRIANLYWRTTYKHLKLFPTVKETLHVIKRNKIRLGIVSDLLAQIQITKLEHLRIAQYFDFIVCSEEVGKEKPFAPIFKLALKKAKYNKSFEVYVIGDDCNKDAIGAKKMNFISIYVGEKPCPIADHSVKLLREIFPIIDVYQELDGCIKFNYSWERATPLRSPMIKVLNRYRSYYYNKGLIGITNKGIGFGNISHRDKRGYIITGNATGGIKHLRPDHYARISNWDYKKNHITCAGATVASSESLSHAAVYDTASQVNAVVHIHDATLWRKLRNRIPTTAPTATYGTPEMTREIKKILKNKGGVSRGALVMGGHQNGLLIFGRTLEDTCSTLSKLQMRSVK